MSNVRLDVVCPCGALLMTRMVNPKSNSKTSGSKRCSSCKNNVRYQIVGAQGYTSYQK